MYALAEEDDVARALSLSPRVGFCSRDNVTTLHSFTARVRVVQFTRYCLYIFVTHTRTPPLIMFINLCCVVFFVSGCVVTSWMFTIRTDGTAAAAAACRDPPLVNADWLLVSPALQF